MVGLIFGILRLLSFSSFYAMPTKLTKTPCSKFVHEICSTASSRITLQEHFVYGY